MTSARRRLGLAAAWLASGALTIAAILRGGLGAVPLLARRLSTVPPAGGAASLSRATAFRFRALVLWRWLRGDNEAAVGLARRYVARARVELREAGAAPAKPAPVVAFDPRVETLAALGRDLRRAPRPRVLRALHPLSRDWSLGALSRDFGDTPVLMSFADGFQMRPLAELRASPDAYVANSEQLLARHPSLLSELDPERRTGAWLGGVPYAVQLFLGARAGSGLTFHCANNWNVFTMLHGRKRWTFVDPAYSYLMYPWITREGAYVASILDHPGIDRADCELFELAPRFEVVLEPGDVLVSPPWWWHRVENLDAETVGAATRWSLPFAAETNRLFTFAQCFSPQLWRTTAEILASVIETGGSLRAHYARLADGPTAIERVAHTREQLLPAAAGLRAWVPGAAGYGCEEGARRAATSPPMAANVASAGSQSPNRA